MVILSLSLSRAELTRHGRGTDTLTTLLYCTVTVTGAKRQIASSFIYENACEQLLPEFDFLFLIWSLIHFMYLAWLCCTQFEHVKPRSEFRYVYARHKWWKYHNKRDDGIAISTVRSLMRQATTTSTINLKGRLKQWRVLGTLTGSSEIWTEVWM